MTAGVPPQDAFVRPRRKRCAALAGLALAIACGTSGCGIAPLTQYNLDVPAVSLRTIQSKPLTDGRARFRDIFCTLMQQEGRLTGGAEQCSKLLHQLSDEPIRWKAAGTLPKHNPALRIVVVPGLLNECLSNLVNVFDDAAERLREKGYQIDWVNVGGLSSSRQNAAQIAQYVRNSPPRTGERLLFVGHSKGAADILEFLVSYPDLADRVSAVVSVAGAVNGSPLADWSAAPLEFWARWIPEGWCYPGDDEALDSLRRSERLGWLSKHTLPDSVAYFSLGTFTDRDRISWPLLAGYDLLSFIDPRNDGQLLFFDQAIPGATLLGYANADHWSVALPVTTKLPWLDLTAGTGPEFPRDLLLEAIVLYVAQSLFPDDAGT